MFWLWKTFMGRFWHSSCHLINNTIILHIAGNQARYFDDQSVVNIGGRSPIPRQTETSSHHTALRWHHFRLGLQRPANLGYGFCRWLQNPVWGRCYSRFFKYHLGLRDGAIPNHGPNNRHCDRQTRGTRRSKTRTFSSCWWQQNNDRTNKGS